MKILKYLIPPHAAKLGRFFALAIISASFILAIACGGPAEQSDTPDQAGSGGRGARAVSSDFEVRGELIFTNRADLAFTVNGEVGPLDVTVGDQVSAGDILATLDAETVTLAQRDAAQALVNLEAAQDGLDQVLGLQSADPLVRARAENELAAAEIALERAQDELDDYQLTHNVQLGAARQSVADAEATVERAEEAVSDFADGYSEQFAEALAARSTAKSTLDRAEDAVTDFLPRHDESVSRLRTQISETRSDLETANEAVRDFDADHADRLAEARQELALAEIKLETANDAFSEFQSKAIAGEFRGLAEGENFDVVQFNALQGAVTIARQAVTSWQIEVSDLKSGPKEVDRSAAIARVVELEATLILLNRELNDALPGPDSDELRSLEAAVEIAKSRLSRADRDLAEAEEGVDQLELAKLQAAAGQARFTLESAQTQLARLEEGLDATKLDALTKAVTIAQEARADLAKEAEPADMALARATINAASTAYEEALKDVAATILTAPFDGVVRVVTISTGDAVTVDARVIQVVDPREVTVLGLVESNYLERIRVGTAATVAMAALPGVELKATVTELSDEARTERGIITFPVVFDVTVPPGVDLPPYPGLVTTTVRQ